MSKGFRLDAFRKPLKAMDGFRERQDGSMRVCEGHQDETPCWHGVFSPGIADAAGYYFSDDIPVASNRATMEQLLL